jgi:hypothetical protein
VGALLESTSSRSVWATEWNTKLRKKSEFYDAEIILTNILGFVDIIYTLE